MKINCSDLYDKQNLDWIAGARSDNSALYKSTLTEVRDLTQLQLKRILTDIINHPENNQEETISEFYNQFKNRQNNFINDINEAFDNYIHADDLDQIHNISFLTGKFSRIFLDILFYLRIVPYEKDTQVTCLRLEAPSLIMPSKEYYITDDYFHKSIRDSYLLLVENILKRSGYIDPYSMSCKILSLEKELTFSKISAEDSRDPEKLCNTLAFKEFNEKSGLEIESIALGAGIQLPDFLVVESIVHLENLLRITTIFPPEVFIAYAQVKFSIKFCDFVPCGSEEIIDFLCSKIAVRRNQSFDTMIIDYISEFFPEYISYKYMQKHFSSSINNEITEMILNIKDSFVDNIKSSYWMSQYYKDNAINKLNGLRIKVGGSDVCNEFIYDKKCTLLDNVLLLLSNNFYLTAKYLNSELDDNIWDLHAHQVNACYNRRKNEIILPASLLQPPLYTSNVNPVENYGMIGIIIAHEISHAIDDEGCFFDENGNLFSLWSETDKTYFYKQANTLASQYSSIEIMPGLYVDGVLTRGEAIADLIGCRMSYQALKKVVTFTPNILEEFIGQVCVLWREYASEEVVRRLTAIGPHAPAKFRALISLAYIENNGKVITGLTPSHIPASDITFI